MFYEALAKHYEEVFPLEPAKVTFLDQEFSGVGARCILDLACGIGTYTLALAEKGYEAWGTDLAEQMIRQAQEKAVALNISAHFAVGDMQYPHELGLTFDGLFCIGNSLAHLESEQSLQQALIAMHNILKRGGAAVFQIVNFDRILANGKTSLPLIERENLRFIRIYNPISAERLEFSSQLQLKQADGFFVSFENSIDLRPIREANLKQYLLTAGFTDINIYGDFRRSAYNSLHSAATVITARA